MPKEKMKIAFYWAAGCGGCEVSVLDIDEKILDVVKIADIIMWPVAMDTKYKDIRAMPEDSIDIVFFNGAIRNNENEEMAHLFRSRAKTLIAFGSCATGGGIVGLGNLYEPEDILKEAFFDSASTDNPDNIHHSGKVKLSEGETEIPELNRTVKALDQVAEVDYYLPGCPPQASQVMEAVDVIASGELPPKGSVIGPATTVCDECDRKPEQGQFKKIDKLVDRLDVEPDPEKCLLEQGFVCMGPATRGGCGAKCPEANVPCTGCTGPAANIKDQGAKMISALASILQTEGEDKKTMEQVQEELDKIKDPAGTFYRYFLAHSILKRKGKDHASSQQADD